MVAWMKHLENMRDLVYQGRLAEAFSLARAFIDLEYLIAHSTGIWAKSGVPTYDRVDGSGLGGGAGGLMGRFETVGEGPDLELVLNEGIWCSDGEGRRFASACGGGAGWGSGTGRGNGRTRDNGLGYPLRVGDWEE